MPPDGFPAALLIQLLVGFGNLIGRQAHFLAEADRHPCNLYVVIVGQTAKGRKGTALGQIERILAAVDGEWIRTRKMGGLASGEGLIWAVRDVMYEHVPVRDHGRAVRYEDVESDAGVTDKRLLVVEQEFARVLQVSEREANTLSCSECAIDHPNASVQCNRYRRITSDTITDEAEVL